MLFEAMNFYSEVLNLGFTKLQRKAFPDFRVELYKGIQSVPEFCIALPISFPEALNFINNAK